jgi:hypothetical protein
VWNEPDVVVTMFYTNLNWFTGFNKSIQCESIQFYENNEWINSIWKISWMQICNQIDRDVIDIQDRI